MSTPPPSSPSPDPVKPGFWSQKTVEGRIDQIVASSKAAPTVKQGAIELRMGCEAFVTGKTGRVALPQQTGEVVIPPGQFALLLTEEKVTIPREAIGFISIKFGLKARGLVNVSGFHVDPGFSGWLTFSVYNAGPSQVTISRGSEVFLLWLASWDQPTPEGDQYSAKNNLGRGQAEKLDDNLIMNLQGEIASPGSLNTKIEDLRKEFNNVQSNQKVIITLFCSFVVAVAMVTWNTTRANKPSSPIEVTPAAPVVVPAAPTLPTNTSNPSMTQSKSPPSLADPQPVGPDSFEHDVLAVVMPGGRAVFALDSHKDQAVTKAMEIAAKSIADQSASPAAFQPAIITFRTSEALYIAIRLEVGPHSEMAILARRQRCGRFVPGYDTGCQGDEHGGYRTILYDHYVCQPGSPTDECWNNYNSTIGRRLTYTSKKACEDGASPTTNDRIPGSSCD